jgi:hypothetical protein
VVSQPADARSWCHPWADITTSPSSLNCGSQHSTWRRAGVISSSSTGEKVSLLELDLLKMRRQTSAFG